jgi:hypothetical protein
MVLLLPAGNSCDSSCTAGTNAKSATSIDKKEFDSTPMPFYKLMQRLFPVILRLAAGQVGMSAIPMLVWPFWSAYCD